MEKFGVTPDKVVDVQALAGDSTDNVPGVPGIGVKTAAQLLGEYGDLETLLARAGEIKQPKRREALQSNAELARISKKLVQLRDDVPSGRAADAFDKRKPDPNVLLPLAGEAGLQEPGRQVRQGAGEATSPVAPAPPTAAVTKPRGRGEAPAPAAHAKPNRSSPSADYELIRTEAALDEWIAEATKAGVVAFDCETDALDSNNAGLVGLSLALLDGPWGNVDAAPTRSLPADRPSRAGEAQGRALDLGGAGASGPTAAARRCAPDRDRQLKPLLEDPGVLKVGQNIKYDMCVFERHGIAIGAGRRHDAAVLRARRRQARPRHGRAGRALSRPEDDQVLRRRGSGAKQVSFDKVPIERAREYAAEDADVTLQLWAQFKPRLAAERMVTMYETHRAAADPGAARRWSRPASRSIAPALQALSRRLREAAGRAGDARSTRSPAASSMSARPSSSARSCSTSRSCRAASAARPAPGRPTPTMLDDLAAQGHRCRSRSWSTASSPSSRAPTPTRWSRESTPGPAASTPPIMMTVAATGRLASTDPNLQNIPVRTEEGRKIREAFIAEKGHKLLSADYSQIELRLLAHVADIASLKEAFARGDDIHAITASEMFGVPVKGMDPLVRRRAKAINFGIIYGISAFGLANQLGIGQREAREYIAKYFLRYPGIRDYMETTKEYARKHGYVRTPFGRKIHLKYINEKNQGMRAFSERAAINAPLQGGAADIIKRAMIRVPGALAAASLKARMLLQVHDELLFEVPDKEIDKTKEVTRTVMESAATLSVPLVVDTGVGLTWAAAHLEGPSNAHRVIPSAARDL